MVISRATKNSKKIGKTKNQTDCFSTSVVLSNKHGVTLFRRVTPCKLRGDKPALKALDGSEVFAYA
jgi:hypothetical protein